jgi:hypothetical protein
MPVAVVQEWNEPETDRSTTSYDAISERLRADDRPIEGFLVHTAGYTGHGFRIFEVWETREHFERFLEERLMPLVHELADAGNTPETTIYELHGFLTPPA